MFVFFHILCLITSGFLAAWAISLNDLRYGDESGFNNVVLAIFIIALLALAFGVATLHV